MQCLLLAVFHNSHCMLYCQMETPPLLYYIVYIRRMCSEWFELVEKAKLSNEQTEQLTIAAQAQFKVMK